LKTIDAATTAVFGGLPAGVAIQALAPRGRPGPGLVRYVTDDRDMIIVGTRRRYRPGTGVGGYCARHAPCPVVIVRSPTVHGWTGPHPPSRSIASPRSRQRRNLPVTPLLGGLIGRRADAGGIFGHHALSYGRRWGSCATELRRRAGPTGRAPDGTTPGEGLFHSMTSRVVRLGSEA
jgi:hypothetical protein